MTTILHDSVLKCLTNAKRLKWDKVDSNSAINSNASTNRDSDDENSNHSHDSDDDDEDNRNHSDDNNSEDESETTPIPQLSSCLTQHCISNPNVQLQQQNDCGYVSRLGILYDLMPLVHRNHSVVFFGPDFDINQPFKTTQDDQIVFAKTTTVIIDYRHNSKIDRVINIPHLFPNLTTLVVAIASSSGIASGITNDLFDYISTVHYTELVFFISDAWDSNWRDEDDMMFNSRLLPLDFIQGLTQMLVSVESLKRLTIYKQGKVLPIFFGGVEFLHPIVLATKNINAHFIDGCIGVSEHAKE
ncbi:Hypothetical protein MVR_LOCUS68 [uncultured virus]|nr:Hypothetical protein MVR_LOCUS68 [uncultured virus]